MKKKISLLLLMLLTVSLAVSLTACFGVQTKTYQILDITYLADDQSNQAWKYTDSHQQYAVNKDNTVELVFEIKLKDSAGNEYTDNIHIYTAGGETDYGLIFISNVGSGGKISYTVAEIPSAEAAKKVPVVITFSQYSDGQFSEYVAELAQSKEITVYVDIVKAIKTHDVSLTGDFKVAYNHGEELDLTGANLDITYRDETSDTIPFAELLEMPQFKGTKLNGFDAETVGLRKSMSFHTEIQDNGSRTKSVAYKVLPDNAWSIKSVPSIDYYLREDMIANTVNAYDLAFERIQLSGSTFTLAMAYDKNYNYAVISPSASAYQTIINAGLTTQNPLHSAFNALVPNGQTATISSATSLRGATVVEYTLTDGTKWTMYVIMTAFTGNLYNQKVITITVENSNLLTETEKAVILDFVSLVAIK